MALRRTALALAARYLGQRVQAAGGIGGECVDLANLWLAEAYGLPHVYRNAVDWAGGTVPGFAWVRNSPINAPTAGDIVVWGEDAAAGTGADGHIAVALSADSMHLCSVDQNWAGPVVSLELHSYDGVLGWLHKT